MSNTTERELRQRQLVAETLSAYRLGKQALGRTVQDLQALACELRLVSPEWLADFQAEINGLEVLYAVALDRGVAPNLPTDYKAEADETMTKLGALLEQLPPLEAGDTS